MTNTLTGTYDLDTTHSTVGFTVRHAMVTKVRGNFKDFQATLTVNEDNPGRKQGGGDGGDGVRRYAKR